MSQVYKNQSKKKMYNQDEVFKSKINKKKHK